MSEIAEAPRHFHSHTGWSSLPARGHEWTSASEPNKHPKRADLTAPKTRHPQAATLAAILWKVELATS